MICPQITLTTIEQEYCGEPPPAGCDALTGAAKTDCQKQWFDYSPGISRYGMWTRDHKRSSAELTAQYEFSKNFNAYVSYQDNKQDQRLNDRNFGTNFENVSRLSGAGKAPVYDGAGRQTTAGTCIPATTTGTPAGMTVRDHYVTFITGIFRSVRFGAASAHGRANIARFNFFRERGALTRDEASGTWRVDDARMREAMNALSETILTLQGNGDYDGVVAFMNRYGTIDAVLQADLDRLSARGIPVDIVFEQ